MTKKLKFVWIDDDPRRISSAKSMEKNIDAKVQFLDVSKKNLKAFFDILKENIFQKSKPDLILIDHKLDKIQGLSSGSTVAELIREKLPDCPILGVTAVDIESEIDYSKRLIYEDIFDIHNMSKNYKAARVIATSYRLLLSKRPKNVDELINFLKAPEVDKERLLKILPTDLRGYFDDKSLLPRISKWVCHVLIKSPGFLYDELWTATMIGLKLNSFKKVSPIFEKAKYKGFFSDDTDPRWWPTRVKEILYKKFKDEEHLSLRELGQKLKDIKHRDMSVCYACKELLPETVAYVDESSLKQEPMHLRCTIPHPKFTQMLFFDEIRVMKGVE